MSSSDSVNAFAMMESVALNESHVIADDIDFVLVEAQNNNDMEIDEDSYDYCEDAVSMLSVEQHSSLSVYSDLPSIDAAALDIETTEETQPERRPRVISFGNEEDELRLRSEKFQASIEPLDERMPESEHDLETAETLVAEPTEAVATVVAEPTKEVPAVVSTEATAKSCVTETKHMGTVSRLSNKKRRKKMKLMKRAAAAAAAAAALSEMTAYMPTAPTLPPPSSPKSSTRRNKKSTSRSKSTSSNVAVACATETIESYRKEVANNKKKGSSKFATAV